MTNSATKKMRDEVSKSLQTQLRLVRLNAVDQLTMELIQARVSTASKRLEAGTFGKCTCCSKNIFLGTLEKDPSQPYCKDCDENFSQTRDMINEKLSSLRKSLAEVDQSVRNCLDCNKKPGKDAADMANPDISTQRFRRTSLQKEIAQCQEVLRAMATGKYEGICLNCEEELEQKRLKAKPHAKFCTSCANGIEKGRITNPPKAFS